jgi:hypothetical protein
VHALVVVLTSLALAACDPAVPVTPGDEPPAGLPPHLVFVEGTRPDAGGGADVVVRPPAYCFVTLPGQSSTRIEAAALDLTAATFALHLTLHTYPYDVNAPFTHTVEGTLAQHGALLALATEGGLLFATLSPDAARPTTVTLVDPDGVLLGNGACRALRFASEEPMATGVAGEADRATYDVLALGPNPLPYRFQVTNAVFVWYDSMRVDLHEDGTYAARLFYRYGDGEETKTATALGTHIGTGPLRALDPASARVSFLMEAEGAVVAHGADLPFEGTGPPWWSGSVWGRLTLRPQ